MTSLAEVRTVSLLEIPEQLGLVSQLGVRGFEHAEHNHSV
jgi:hypothetical protein